MPACLSYATGTQKSVSGGCAGSYRKSVFFDSPSSAKRRLEWMRCGSHPERCVDEKIPRPPRPYGQHDYGACQRQAPTGRIRHHRPEQECCRTVVKDDGRDWSRGVNVMTRFSFQPGLARKTACSDQQNMAMWL